MFTGSAPRVWRECRECFPTFHESDLVHLFSVVNFTMLSLAIVLVSWEWLCEGFSDLLLLCVPIVSGANCSYKEIGPDHLTTKLVSYQIPVPHLRSDCLLIYIYSLMTWPGWSDGHWTSDISWLRCLLPVTGDQGVTGAQFVSYCINITSTVQPYGRSLGIEKA